MYMNVCVFDLKSLISLVSIATARVIDLSIDSTHTSTLEETGGLGVDCILQTHSNTNTHTHSSSDASFSSNSHFSSNYPSSTAVVTSPSLSLSSSSSSSGSSSVVASAAPAAAAAAAASHDRTAFSANTQMVSFFYLRISHLIIYIIWFLYYLFASYVLIFAFFSVILCCVLIDHFVVDDYFTFILY